MQDPDKDLIAKAQAGSKDAFGKLVTKHYDMAYAVAFGVVNNREDARDVVQDVFIKLFRDFNKFEGRSKFKSWLYRVTVNAAIDRVRRRKPTVPIDGDSRDGADAVLIPLVDTTSDPRDHASRREVQKLVREAVRKLSPDHRAVLALREWGDMSYEEIADILEIEEGTVMSRLHYARKKLAEILTRNKMEQEVR